MRKNPVARISWTLSRDWERLQYISVWITYVTFKGSLSTPSYSTVHLAVEEVPYLESLQFKNSGIVSDRDVLPLIISVYSLYVQYFRSLQ